MIESMASMAAVFIMLTVLVQVSLGLSAKSAADIAVSAAARRVSLADAGPGATADALGAELAALIPGAQAMAIDLTVDAQRAVARARFRWMPPGPVLVPVWITTTAEVPRAVPP